MDKKLKILLDKVKESDPNLNTMDRNTRIRAGNYQFPFSGQQMDYLLLNLAKKLSGDDILIFSDPSNPQTVLTEITKYQLDDLDKVTHEEHILTLEIGDSAEVSERNLEKLRANAGEHFLCNLDYGYGVGRWNPTDGGSSVIMTSEGIKTSWDLAQDGSISKIEDEILPDVPYRVSIQDSSINGIVEEVLGSQILKASVLVIEGGSTGPISYLRCADSTGTAVYFASITKSLKVSVLTYRVSTRNLTQAFVDIVNSEGIANSLYQYLGFTEEELTTEQFKNGLKNAILAYKDGPIA
jgi:hypothetical protein